MVTQMAGKGHVVKTVGVNKREAEVPETWDEGFDMLVQTMDAYQNRRGGNVERLSVAARVAFGLFGERFLAADPTSALVWLLLEVCRRRGAGLDSLEKPRRCRSSDEKASVMEWLADCDFLNERFDSIGAAWADRQIHPRDRAAHGSAAIAGAGMVFYAAAFGALKAARTAAAMSSSKRGWPVAGRFSSTLACCRVSIRGTLPVFSPEAVQNEMAAIVEHQHGYWQAGARAALLCLRAGCASAALKAEIDAAGKEIAARHAAEGRTP